MVESDLSRSDIPWNRHVDTVVIGGGGAGMAAALSAAEVDPDGDVLLLQKIGGLGGSTSMAVGSFTAAGTELQAENGIEDSVEHHFQDLDKFLSKYEKGAGRGFYLDFDGEIWEKDNLELRRLLVENAPETLEWMRGWGCEYAGPYPEGFNRVPRMHNITPDTEAYADVLGDALEEQGVEILFNTEAYELVPADGEIAGVLAQKSGRRNALQIEARRGVVLAAGDYINNEDLRAEFTSNSSADPINEHNTGDGHEMAREVGAELVNMDVQYLSLRFGSPLWTGPEVPDMVDHGAIIVNARGERFLNETVDYDQLFTSLTRQPNQVMYLVFDDEIAEVFTEWPHPVSTFSAKGWGYIDDYREYSVLSEAESQAALAERTGFDEEVFAETVTQYNEAADRSRVDKFGRTDYMARLDESPFYALGPVYPFSLITDGGVAVDEEMRALTLDGDPIEGLYAAGNVAGDLLLLGHGHHHAWIFMSGRIAGRNAATR